LIGGAMLFGRFLMTYYSGNPLGDRISTEWVRGTKLCTFKGLYHLAWSIPLAEPTYYVPGTALHSFLMFAPYLAIFEWNRK